MNPHDPRVQAPVAVPAGAGVELSAPATSSFFSNQQLMASASAFMPLAVHRVMEYLSLQWGQQPWNMVALHLVPPLAMLVVSLLVWRVIPPLPGASKGKRSGAHRGLCIAAGMLLGTLAAAANLLSMLATNSTTAARGMLDAGSSALVAHVMLLAPISEEVAFRGVIHRHLRQFMLPLTATLSSALIFSLMHGNLTQMVWAFVLGVVAAFAYEQTRSLLTPILIHGLFNSVPIGVAVARSHPTDVGPIWLVLFVVAMIFVFAARSASQQAELQ